MTILSILDRLSALPTTPAARRDALARLGTAGLQTAVAALPLVAAVAQPASAKATDTVLDGIKLLVLLEQAQVAFYTQALASGVVPAAALTDFQLLRNQQQQHLDTLSRILTDAALTVPPAPAFDFSGQKNTPTNPVKFPNVFTDYASFLQLAQQLEDASVRIYLGQLPALAAERLIYVAAVKMQATESRHAAHLRTLRREAAVGVKSWPSTADAALPNPVEFSVDGATTTTKLYAGAGSEANEFQLIPGPKEVPFATLLTVANGLAVPSTAIAEAFDEPLPTAAAQALLNLFR